MSDEPSPSPDTTIWIEDGCIQCFWCKHLEPAIFLVESDRCCAIRAEVREDGVTDPNRDERSHLRDGTITLANASFLQFIADGCPTHVIHIGSSTPVTAQAHL